MFCISVTCNLVKIGKKFNIIIKITNGKKPYNLVKKNSQADRPGIAIASFYSMLCGIHG